MRRVQAPRAAESATERDARTTPEMGHPTTHEPWGVLVQLSAPSVRALKELAEYGVYGRTAEEVAARMIDRALIPFVDEPLLLVPPRSRRVRR